MTAAEQRYSTVAIVLHWLIGLSIIGLITAGLIMTNLKPGSSLQFQMYQLHKSGGITVLLLSLFRLAWRFTHPVPPLPDNLRTWERIAARATHIGFYVLMIAIPMSGWAMVSASVWNIPTVLYGIIPWPHISFLANLENKEPVEDALSEVHEYLAFCAIGLLVLHVGAALKHHFVLRDNVLVRMLPWLRSREA